MRFGAHIFGVGALAEPATLVAVARLAEHLGYHSVFLADHIVALRHLESKSPYSQDGGCRTIRPKTGPTPWSPWAISPRTVCTTSWCGMQLRPR